MTPVADNMSLRTRFATEADLARLIPLINAAYSIETFLEGTRTDQTRLAAMMSKGSILLAEDITGTVLACVFVEVRGTRGYLGLLAVDPARQRAGIGRFILHTAEDHLRKQGCQAVDITVLSLRSELPPLYRRLGYVETGKMESIPAGHFDPATNATA